MFVLASGNDFTKDELKLTYFACIVNFFVHKYNTIINRVIKFQQKRHFFSYLPLSFRKTRVDPVFRSENYSENFDVISNFCKTNDMADEKGNHCSSGNTHMRNTGRRKSPEKICNGSRYCFNSLNKFGERHLSCRNNWCYSDFPDFSSTNFLPCGYSIRKFREDRDTCSDNNSCSTSTNSSPNMYQTNFFGPRNRKNMNSDDDQSCTWLYMIVWLVSVVAYINGLSGDFVHDDLSAITSNPDVTGKNPLYQTFLNDYWGKPLSHPLSHKSYRPLTILTFRWVLDW